LVEKKKIARVKIFGQCVFVYECGKWVFGQGLVWQPEPRHWVGEASLDCDWNSKTNCLFAWRVSKRNNSLWY